MKPSYGGRFAATSTLRRDPTAPELAGGLPCGAADQKLFNEFFSLVTLIADEIRNVLIAASITPSEATSTQLRDAILALAPAVGGGGSTTFATLAEHLAGTSQTLSTHPYGVAHMIADAVAAIVLPVIPGVSDPVTYDSGTNKYGARKATVSLGGYGRAANSAEALAGTSATIDGLNLPWMTPELVAMVISDRLAAYHPDMGNTAIGAIRGATVAYNFCNILDDVSGASIAAAHASVTYGGKLFHDADTALWPGTWRARAVTWSDGYANSWLFQRVA